MSKLFGFAKWCALLIGFVVLLPNSVRTAWSTEPPNSTLSSFTPPSREPLRDPIEYDGDWEYRWGDSPRDQLGRLMWAQPGDRSSGWLRLNRHQRLPGRNGSRWLWLRFPVPSVAAKDLVLQLTHVDQALQVYLDGQVVYEWGEFTSAATVPFPGFRGHIIRLPSGSSGKTLLLRIYSEHRNIGPAWSIAFGEHADVIAHLFLSELPRLLVGGLLLLLGTLGFSLYWLRREDRVFLAYGVLSVSGGVYLLSQAQVRSFVFDYPLLLAHVQLWSLQITMLANCHLLEELFGQGPWRLLYRLRQFHWLYLVGSSLAVGLGIVPLLSTLLPVQMVIFADFAAAVALPLYMNHRGNVEARIFGIGFIVAGAIAIRDVCVSVGILARTQQRLGHLGYALFFVTLGFILIRRMVIALTDRDRAIAMFGQHVSPKVAERLLREQEGGASELRHVCVLFLDIRDFTRFSESRTPGEVVHFLNTLFDPLVAVVDRHGGIINKFLGDGFLAIFGAPLSDGKHCASAVQAALALVREVDSLVKAGTIPPTRIGIGLHAGEVVVGSVGSHLRREYTVIGDAVNLTSRIEQLTKSFGAQILASEAVIAQQPEGSAQYEKLATVQVKGREAPVQVYKLA